jgi:DNA-binding phage protein
LRDDNAKRPTALSSNGLGTSARVFDDNDIVQLLRAAIEREGNQVAFAKRHGINRSYLNMVLNGRRSPGSSVAKALGLRVVFVAV